MTTNPFNAGRFERWWVWWLLCALPLRWGFQVVDFCWLIFHGIYLPSRGGPILEIAINCTGVIIDFSEIEWGYFHTLFFWDGYMELFCLRIFSGWWHSQSILLDICNLIRYILLAINRTFNVTFPTLIHDSSKNEVQFTLDLEHSKTFSEITIIWSWCFESKTWAKKCVDFQMLKTTDLLGRKSFPWGGDVLRFAKDLWVGGQSQSARRYLSFLWKETNSLR